MEMVVFYPKKNLAIYWFVQVVEPAIDEQSPDEDDRMALKFLKESLAEDDHGDDSDGGIYIYIYLVSFYTYSESAYDVLMSRSSRIWRIWTRRAAPKTAKTSS